MDFDPFANRLKKNFRHVRRWAKRQELNAFRIYDQDVPGFPFAVDWYDGRVHVIDYPRRQSRRLGDRSESQQEVLAAIAEVLEVPRERVYLKTHEPKIWGQEQYGRAGQEGEWFTVLEQGLRFWVNLGEYLDTGLFLDHRLTRARIREEARSKRFLNLFSYTGSFTVYAAAGGAKQTTSVDLSGRYLDWAARNLAANQLGGPDHKMIRADALAWVEEACAHSRAYDLVVVDPPPFSASDRMRRAFDVQRDHPGLLRSVLQLVTPPGALYFSTSFQAFQLETGSFDDWSVEEITPKSLPADFRRRRIHRCWRFVRKGANARPSPSGACGG